MITPTQVKVSFTYDPTTGIFTRNHPCKGHRAGEVCGALRKDGYVVIGWGKQKILAHRLAWLYTYGSWPTECIDHINGNPTDNRINNLREASQSENTQNRRKACVDNKSGLLGVHWCTRDSKWIAQIMFNNKKTFIGAYNTDVEAAEAYLAKKRELHEFSTI